MLAAGKLWCVAILLALLGNGTLLASAYLTAAQHPFAGWQLRSETSN